MAPASAKTTHGCGILTCRNQRAWIKLLVSKGNIPATWILVRERWPTSASALIAENWKNANIAMLWTPESLPLNCATCWPALVRKCLRRRWKLLKSLNSIPRCFINHLPGGAADTWQGGLAGKHQLWGVCQDGSRPIGGDGGGGRDGERPWPGSRTFSPSLSFKFYLFNPFVFY